MCGKLKFDLSILIRATVFCAVATVCFFCGCSGEIADLMDDGPTATEAKLILDRSSEIRVTPDASNPLPAVYRQDPEVLKTSKGWKVFYYARNHSPKTIAELMKGQLKNSVTFADDTNQLIINCADQADVDQVLSYLESVDIAPIQVKIDCIIVENYADVTMDRETQVKVGDLAEDAGLIIEGPANGWGTFPGASIRESRRTEMGMSIGYDSKDLKFLIDMLVSRGYLKVLMNPSVETVTGATATVSSVDQMPTIKQVTDAKTKQDYELTEYIDVEDTLKITPEVFADGSVSLTCEAKLSSKNTPEGVAQLPIVTERTIKLGSTRLQPGKSLVVGGFRKSEKSSVVRGFPFLKDLPIIGIVFSSRDFEERAKEITFILTPSVSTNGIPYSEMLEQMATDQLNEADPNDIKASINKIFTDPFGKGAYTDEINRAREDDAIKRLRAEVLSAETEIEAQKAREKLEAYQAKLRQEKALIEKASQQSTENQKKIADIEAAIEKLKQEAAAQKAQYEQSLQKTQSQMKTTEQQAQELKQQTEQAKAGFEKQQAELQKALEQREQLEKEKKELIEMRARLRKDIEKAEAEILETEGKSAPPTSPEPQPAQDQNKEPQPAAETQSKEATDAK
jgi:Flp pilus assembly secretin CpaC